MIWAYLSMGVLFAFGAAVFVWLLRRRGVQNCFVPYLLDFPSRRARRVGEPIHLILCLADHFEPCWGSASVETAQERVDRWVREYPLRFGRFRDSDGLPPRHTFFYPLEEYEPAHLDALAQLCHDGFGEVEVHLHHDNDTSEHLRSTLLAYKEMLARRHGLLARHARTHELAYGFIHGNWALANSSPDGRCCGVNDEIDILRQTGCYADFTLPSAPSPTQTRKINSIYYACDDPNHPKSHDTGIDVAVAPAPANGLVMIQGPLLFDWSRRKYGALPGLENGCLQASQPPTPARLDLWLKARIHVWTRPDWLFVKLYGHGAKEANADMMLGEPMVRFHQHLARLAAEDPNFHYHYVTAREMYNLVRAAEASWHGSVAAARDFELVWNGHRNHRDPPPLAAAEMLSSRAPAYR